MTDSKRHIKKNKFQQHFKVLIWKSYLQRLRRWRLLIAEAILSGMLFLIAVIIAKPVFLTTLKDQPEPPLTSEDILSSLSRITILGYAPNTIFYHEIMERAGALLKISVVSAPTYGDLNVLLYNNLSKSRKRGRIKVIWVIFKPKPSDNVWKFAIRSTDMAILKSGPPPRYLHLRSGFLAVQLAVSQAIIDYSSARYPYHDVSLVSMPVTPLMQKDAVLGVISQILLVFTIALLPPVFETEVIVINETTRTFKRALCMHDVSYSAMYLGWLTYAFLTALPICGLGSIALILIFRWLHLAYVMIILISYQSIMMMLALIMAMFHDKARIACIWSTLVTLMQTLLAELMVHHGYDSKNTALTFIGHMFIPPLGLVHGFNQFSLLQTGKGVDVGQHLYYTTASWLTLVLIYFIVLMLLQRVIGSDKAIGGQVSWKSIVFKQLEDENKLRPIETPTGSERDRLQKVDELVAKAISFYNVSKHIMGVPILSNVTFDLYRGELSSLFSERSQDKLMVTIEDLIVGLTYADRGTINILGTEMKRGRNVLNEPFMVGYCHRSGVLIEDLTVEEHIQLFAELSLWNESTQSVTDYVQMRMKHLFRDCNLTEVGQACVKNLGMYYKAQLCWAIAMLLEPRIVVIPNFADDTLYEAVLRDKIVTHRKYLTIVKISFTVINMEYADRIFVFDNKLMSFGGTPAYMFFKYGREYRVRLTFESEAGLNTKKINQLIDIAAEAGASVRAHLGSLLLLRLPCSPTKNVAALVKNLALNGDKYGVTSMNISLPDSEEVFNRSIATPETDLDKEGAQQKKEALQKISDIVMEKPVANWFLTINHIKSIGWKCCTFYIHYRLFIIITLMSTIVAGVFIGLDLSSNLISLEKGSKAISKPTTLTVEAMDQKTVLVIRLDNTTTSRSVATAYAISHTNATQKEVDKMSYTAIMRPESLLEYLVTRAIDSPQQYVSQYAYGIDVATGDMGNLIIQALYSPLHKDTAAAARSLSRVYTSLLRHYTEEPDAAIEVINEPLTLDQVQWIKHAKDPPLIVTAFLVVTITHILLIPSMEQGFLRHVQAHAYNFSPVRYWFSLYMFDLIVYWLLVAIMTGIMYGIIYLNVPHKHFYYKDLLVVPFVLMVYGIGCIPQAYLFSLGPRPALNAMAFILFNIVFGETTIVDKFLYGNLFNYAVTFMTLSPQFNIAIALLKTKLIFLYNSECLIYKIKKLCTATKIHKCCKKCGLIQACFKRHKFLTVHGLLMDILATINSGVIFTVVLLLWNYRCIQRFWHFLISKLYIKVTEYHIETETIGVKRQMTAALAKKKMLKHDRRNLYKDSFGENLLVANLCKGRDGIYVIRNIYFGLSKGEALAISGLKRHGRLQLIYLLTGFLVSTKGNVWSVSKHDVKRNLHNYTRHVSVCCDLNAVPYWMTVYDALELIAVLRGMSQNDIKQQLNLYIQVLELEDKANLLVRRLMPAEQKRLNFAAAVIGAPPVIALDECTAYQKYSVRRAMYHILNHLKKKGHSIIMSSHNVENHMPVTNRLAIVRDGHLIDIDQVDQIIARYGNTGYTVVVHLKDEVDFVAMFSKYFQSFTVNDTSEVLVNVQVLDPLSWDEIFTIMETLGEEHKEVYSYIITATPIDYVYNSILQEEKGLRAAPDFLRWWPTVKQYFSNETISYPPIEKIKELQTVDRKYNITKLKELPWSVIFHR